MAIETTRDLCLSVADAIREKKGSSDLINPQDFAKEIASIEGGGSGGGESASTIQYLDVSGESEDLLNVISIAGLYVKTVDDNGVYIMPLSTAMMGYPVALCVDFSAEIYNPKSGNSLVSIRQALIDIAGISQEQLDSIPRLTKEEFYHIDKSGAYIQHIDGTLYTANQWTAKGFSNDEANGVAVINERDGVSVVVAKDTFDPMPWSSKPTTFIEGVTTTINWDDAKKRYTGADDTAKIAAFDPDSAAGKCANYTFPNGQKGYLPSAGELNSIYDFEFNIDELMTLIGGAAFKDSWLWTSLQYSAEDAWYFYFGSHDIHNQPKSTNNVCRPICAYIKND